MSAQSLESLKKVMSSDLCTRCGSCVGLSEGRIIFKDREGSYTPEVIDEISEEHSARLLYACPGHSFDFPHFRTLVF